MHIPIFLIPENGIMIVLISLFASLIVYELNRRKVSGGYFMLFCVGLLGAMFGLFISYNSFEIEGMSLVSIMFTSAVTFILQLFYLVLTSFLPFRVSNPFISRYEEVYFHQITKNASKPNRDLMKFIKRLHYPVSKKDIIYLAEKQDNDEKDLSDLEKLDDHIYDNSSQITSQLSS